MRSLELTTVAHVDKRCTTRRGAAKELGLVVPVLEHQEVHRDKEDAYIGRILRMWNVETLPGSANAVSQA